VVNENKSWKELCEAASNEFDSERLTSLISELVKVMDDSARSSRDTLQPQSSEHSSEHCSKL
jgi:hypothetical protein